jgi:tetratricopeptide (TPR) repeat protein
MQVSKVALAALCLVGGGAALAVSAAAAQQPLAPAAARPLTLTGAERAALLALRAAAAGPDRIAQDAALAAARAAATGADARYAVAHYQAEIARARGDGRMLGEAVDALVASGLATADELPSLVANQAARAYAIGEYQRSERLLARAVELQPSNPALLADHAQLRSLASTALIRNGRQAEGQAAMREAVAMLSRAIELQRASGQIVPESWYLRALALAFDSRQAPQGIALARSLVTYYPTPLNWRDALLSYRQLAAPDPALDLDVRRLLRAAGALSGERDYLELAQALRAANPSEAKAVLDEGVSRGMLDPAEAQVRSAITAATRPATTERTGLARARTQAMAAATGGAARGAGDAHFGNAQYAEAVELYGAALQKGGEDTNLVNTRLGAALALAGRRAEAEAAFRSVTGPRADLAGFWLAWLARRPA